MNNILAVTLISYKEGLRHRVLYGIFIFAVLIMAFAVLISGLFMRDITKVTLDLCLTAVNIGGLLVPFFLAIYLLAKDIERRTVYSILSRSISRTEYLLGKFGGLVLLTGTIMGTLTLAVVAAIWGSRQLYAGYFFTSLSWPAILTAILASYLGIVVLNACVILWSTMTTSSFLATLLTLFTYIIGQTVEDIVRFMSVKTPGVELSPFFLKVSHAVLYIFPNLAAFDLKQSAAHGLLVPAKELLFLTTYGLGYTTAALTLAILIFRRRDLA